MKKNDFPLFKTYPELVYLDSAATVQKPQVVIDSIVEFYERYNANVHRGIYSLSELATDKYEKAREKVANFLNAEFEEVIFTQGITDSMNAIATMLAPEFIEGDTIITTELEHHSSFLPFQSMANNKKINLEYVRLNKDLTLDYDHLEKMKASNKKLKAIVVSAMSNVTGYTLDIKKIREIIGPDIYLIVDAAQYIPHKNIDVVDWDVDFLGFSGHKLYGPTGIGVLYGKKQHLARLQPFRTGGGMITKVKRLQSEYKSGPERYEAGTPHIAGAYGLGIAIDYVSNIGYKSIIKHEKELTEYALNKLNSLKFVETYVSKDRENSTGVISFNIRDIHAHDTADILGQNNVAVRAGHHCAQILVKEILKTDSTTRMSVGIYNEKEDVDKLIEALYLVQQLLG